jgi:hypothetical protein
MVVDREIVRLHSVIGRPKESGGKISARLQLPEQNPQADRAASTSRSTGGYSTTVTWSNTCAATVQQPE